MVIDGRLLTCAGVLIFFLCIIGGSLGLSSAARLGPLLAGSAGFVCAALELLALLRRDSITGGSSFARIGNLQELSFFAWLLALLLLVLMLGMLAGFALWLGTFLHLQYRRPVGFVLCTAGGVSLFLYLVFDQLLQTPLFSGWLPMLL